MKIGIRDVTCKDAKAYTHVLDYMVRVSNFKKFDDSMPIIVYVNDEHDLIGFESPKYRIQFVNNAHKLYEIKNSSVTVDPVPYSAVREHFLAMGAGLPF